MTHKIFPAVALLALFLFSCKNTADKNSTPGTNDCTEYACPMHPDHTSTVPAKCPECNMDMEAVKKNIQKDTLSAP